MRQHYYKTVCAIDGFLHSMQNLYFLENEQKCIDAVMLKGPFYTGSIKRTTSCKSPVPLHEGNQLCY